MGTVGRGRGVARTTARAQGARESSGGALGGGRVSGRNLPRCRGAMWPDRSATTRRSQATQKFMFSSLSHSPGSMRYSDSRLTVWSATLLTTAARSDREPGPWPHAAASATSSACDHPAAEAPYRPRILTLALSASASLLHLSAGPAATPLAGEKGRLGCQPTSLLQNSASLSAPSSPGGSGSRPAPRPAEPEAPPPAPASPAPSPSSSSSDDDSRSTSASLPLSSAWATAAAAAAMRPRCRDWLRASTSSLALSSPSSPSPSSSLATSCISRNGRAASPKGVGPSATAEAAPTRSAHDPISSESAPAEDPSPAAPVAAAGSAACSPGEDAGGDVLPAADRPLRRKPIDRAPGSRPNDWPTRDALRASMPVAAAAAGACLGPHCSPSREEDGGLSGGQPGVPRPRLGGAACAARARFAMAAARLEALPGPRILAAVSKRAMMARSRGRTERVAAGEEALERDGAAVGVGGEARAWREDESAGRLRRAASPEAGPAPAPAPAPALGAGTGAGAACPTPSATSASPALRRAASRLVS
mmetsp:Transcript_11651/g.45341  ORF Transcript_11651/g.45341 Transcript_11651/m.45341 type:complete len:535 (-) Transcript_11651:163-1767(-)